MKAERNAISVSQLNQYIKTMMDRDEVLAGVFVSGEISNYKAYPSGHHYFSLKDAEGAIRCVMFRSDAVHLRFRPENGMRVIACGRVTVFPRDGQYQLYCSRLLPDGAGDLNLAFEQLKRRLAQEGLFAPEHKKPIPRYPGRIALITSSAGAAVRDMIRVLGARWPMSRVFLLPVRVQGAEAPPELVKALHDVNRWNAADVVILGRGGGSMEDLWAFNDERLASAIYASKIPVISAVGHEPDVTIADYVADLRAATPSNGAELATPDQTELYAKLLHLKARLERPMQARLEREKKSLARLSESRALTDPMASVQDRRLLLDYQTRRLEGCTGAMLARGKQRLGVQAAALDALSPLKVLGRGYAIAEGEDGTVLSSVEQLPEGRRFALTLFDGQAQCAVLKKE